MRRLQRQCEICSAVFRCSQKNSATRFTCSRKCGRTRRLRQRPDRRCRMCGAALVCAPSVPMTFCSPTCARRARREHTHEIRKCKSCGQPFVAYRFRSRQTQFCSKSCYDQIRRKPRICQRCKRPFWFATMTTERYCPACWLGLQLEAKRRIEARKCQTCGRSGIESQAKFCSPECANLERRKKNVVTPCNFCGAPVSRNLNDVKRRKYIFCGRDCSDAFLFFGGPAITDAKEKVAEYLSVREARRGIKRTREILRTLPQVIDAAC
jgi:hypothetical protein